MRMLDRSPANAVPDPGELEQDLIALIEESRERSSEDPFRNPVLAVTLAITRRFDREEIDDDDLDGLFTRLRAQSLIARAERLRGYVGLDRDTQTSADNTMPARLVAAIPKGTGDFETFRDLVGRTGFAVVFTAHPTFGMPKAVAALIAEAASQDSEAARLPLLEKAAALSTRPDCKDQPRRRIRTSLSRGQSRSYGVGQLQRRPP